MVKYIALFVLFSCSVFPTKGQTIPPERRVAWDIAGFGGPVPQPGLVLNVRDFGATGNGTTDDHTAIVNAINALSGNEGVVFFPAGNYLIGSPLNLTDSVVLRGAGADSTTLAFNLGNASQNCIQISRGQASQFVPLTGNYFRGSQAITVSDPSLFSPGGDAEIRQENGPWDTSPASWATDVVGQMVTIASISGDTLFLNHPLRISFDSLLHPEIQPVVCIAQVAIECLKVYRADSAAEAGSNISFSYASNCRVQGVESYKSIGSHIGIYTSTNITISGCYIHDAYLFDGTSTRGYGVTLNNHTGACLVRDNIFKRLRHAMMVKTGANGNVFSYNHSIDPIRSEPISDFSGDISLHGHYAFANLFEGNICQNIIIDHYWGPSGPWNTFFRNRAELYGIIMTSSENPTEKQNFVGNEVTSTAPLHGLYLLTGSDHFTYGNNIKGIIQPPGTTSLPDTSCYLTVYPPDFWTLVETLPTIGIPNNPGSGSIPARQRYLSGPPFTVCPDSIITDAGEINNFTNNAVRIFPNPFGKSLSVWFESEAEQGFMIELTDLFGRTVFRQSHTSVRGINQLTVTPAIDLKPGIYLVRIITGDQVLESKVIRVR